MKWKTQAEVVFFRVIERHVLTMPRSTGLGSGTSPRFEFSRDVNTGAPVDPGGSSARVSAAGGVSSESLFEAANVSLVRIDGLLETVCGELARVPSTVERLSRVDGILPPATVLMLSLRRRFCQLKLDFLKSFIKALPTCGLALGCSRKCRMLIASLLKMRQVLL